VPTIRPLMINVQKDELFSKFHISNKTGKLSKFLFPLCVILGEVSSRFRAIRCDEQAQKRLPNLNSSPHERKYWVTWDRQAWRLKSKHPVYYYHHHLRNKLSIFTARQDKNLLHCPPYFGMLMNTSVPQAKTNGTSGPNQKRQLFFFFIHYSITSSLKVWD
jgi:hypothetical protein